MNRAWKAVAISSESALSGVRRLRPRHGRLTRQPVLGHAGRLLPRQLLGLGEGHVLVCDDVLGVGALGVSLGITEEQTHAVHEAEDLVADLVQASALADLDDGAGELDTEGGGSLGRDSVLALALEDVHSVQAKSLGLVGTGLRTNLVLDEQLILARRRRLNLADVEAVSGALAVLDDNSLHLVVAGCRGGEEVVVGSTEP